MNSTYNYTKTMEYYAIWLDIPIKQLYAKGITLIKTNKRRICPKGHPRNLEMYCLALPESLLISYSPELDSVINFTKQFEDIMTTNDGIAKLREIFPNILRHRKAHYFTALPEDIDLSKVVKLTKEHYNDYLKFFMAQYPNASPDGWLLEYFNKIADNNRCFGIYEDNVLACVTGAPDIPFIEEVITEPGIDTLQEYRRKGYAQAVCAMYLKCALEKNEVPIWTCWHDNSASFKLAERLGYKYLCDLFTIEGEIPYAIV